MRRALLVFALCFLLPAPVAAQGRITPSRTTLPFLELTGDLTTSTATGPVVVDEASSVTNPTLIPDKTELGTGVGGTGNDLSLIVENLERLRIQNAVSAATIAAMVIDNPDVSLNDGATARYRSIGMNQITVTLAGTTQVTTANQGMALRLNATALEQSGGAVTVDEVSTLHVAIVTCGTDVTCTDNRMISTDVTDAFLTASGVWTDTVSTRKVKDHIAPMPRVLMADALDQLQPKVWMYNEHFNNDLGADGQRRYRMGLIAEEFPEFLRVPGEATQSGVSASVIANFALAASVYQEDRIDTLEAQIDVLLELVAELESRGDAN